MLEAEDKEAQRPDGAGIEQVRLAGLPEWARELYSRLRREILAEDGLTEQLLWQAIKIAVELEVCQDDLRTHGYFFNDRKGQAVMHPAARREAVLLTALAKIHRSLGLDQEPADDKRQGSFFYESSTKRK